MELRQLLSNYYSDKLKVVENKSKDIWENGAVYFPYYTLHGIKHSDAVIDVLDLLIAGLNTENQLEEVEIFCLLSAAYLHDVGMQRKYPDDEARIEIISKSKNKPYIFQDLIRDEHHLRSGRYIKENYKILGLDHIEAECVRLVSEAHRKVDLLSDEYDPQAIGSKRIRVRLLSSFLRLADELDIDYRRAPETLYEILKEDMPDFSRLQWLKHHYTNGVIIEPVVRGNKRSLNIEVNCQYPIKGIKVTEVLVLKPIEKTLEELKSIFLDHGLKFDLTHKVKLNKDLDQIPEYLLKDDSGNSLVIPLETPTMEEFLSKRDELKGLLNSLNRNIGELIEEGRNDELIELLDSLNITIEEIKEKTKVACRMSKGTSAGEIACTVNNEVQKWEIGSQEEMAQKISDMIFILKSKIPLFPKNKYLFEIIDSIKDEKDILKQYESLALIIGSIPTIQTSDRNVIADCEQTKPTIGIITALPKEFAAVKILLENLRTYKVGGKGAGIGYCLGEITSIYGEKYNIVLSTVSMGNNIAASRASLLLEHFPKVESIIMVGIAGGVPDPKNADSQVHLGDIVVSGEKGVIQYDFVKEEIEKIEYRYSPRPPSASLLEAVRYLEAEEIEGNYPWINYIYQALSQLKMTHPPENSDPLYHHENGETSHPFDSKKKAGQPRVFIGPIASANKLLKNPVLREELRDKFGAKAIEMETSGIADATWNHEVGYLVVRGICDYCDSHKNDEWQQYAAVVAAAYTRALIESMP